MGKTAMVTDETKEEFEARYSEYNPDAFLTRVAMLCSCEEGGGPVHWAAIPNDEESIADHLRQEEWRNLSTGPSVTG